ncbi:histone acetylation protein-domain-containing protein [Mortierella sp. GBAus27b]|nr:hypothetical protein BGX31_007700 [Mortierella sp. GBA43]KAI8360199.1 histone acetylation protein-domain-containing protein [Mortierella sp. GBAus27b]
MTIQESDTRLHSQDPVLLSIASELPSIINDTIARRSPQAPSSDNGDASSAEHKSTITKSFKFCLESFLTHPRTCTKLYPPQVQRKRYSRITVQERLILLSVEASPTIPQEPSNADQGSSAQGPLLIAGLEVLEYTLFPLTTSSDPDTENDQQADGADTSNSSQPRTVERIIYIAKVDTSGCWSSCGINTSGIKSPARTLVSGYLKSMRAQHKSHTHGAASPIAAGETEGTASGAAAQMSSLMISPSLNKKIPDDSTPCTDTTEKAPVTTDDQGEQFVTKTTLYVFARAQPQYLFKDSAKNTGKHVLSDRGLVRWWKNMLTSAYNTDDSSTSGDNTSDGSKESKDPSESSPEQAKEAGNATSSSATSLRGWWFIPGIGSERQALGAIQPLSQPSNQSSSSPSFNLTYGYPHKGSKEMAQTVIPQFPDDPKSRIMRSPMGACGLVNIDTFWELTAIGEESGAGRISGYLCVEEKGHEQDPALTKKEPLKTQDQAKEETPKSTETTAESQDTVIGSTDDYTKIINELLGLDFNDATVAVESTKEWKSRVDEWVHLANNQETKSRPSWIQRTVVSVELPPAEQTNSVNSLDTTASLTAETAQQPPAVNTLGSGLIKRKDPGTSTPTQQQPVINVLGGGFIKRKVSDQSIPKPLSQAPAVDVLGAGLIKGKVSNQTTTTLQPAVNNLGPELIKRKAPSSTTSTADEPLSTSSLSPPSTGSTATGNPTPDTSTPGVNILGPSFIKKRKVDS